MLLNESQTMGWIKLNMLFCFFTLNYILRPCWSKARSEHRPGAELLCSSFTWNTEMLCWDSSKQNSCAVILKPGCSLLSPGEQKVLSMNPAAPHSSPRFWFISLGWDPSISFKCSPFFNVIQWTARPENSWSNENNCSKQEWFVEFQPCPEWDTAKVFNPVFRETNLWILKKSIHTHTQTVSLLKKLFYSQHFYKTEPYEITDIWLFLSNRRKFHII